MDSVSIHGVWIGFTYIQIHPEGLENATIHWINPIHGRMDEFGTLAETYSFPFAEKFQFGRLRFDGGDYPQSSITISAIDQMLTC
jgi:hypothetical protein